MSMKENMDFVKNELNSEEKFLESFVKLERFYKKNKFIILTLLAIIVLAIVAFVVKKELDEKNKIKANIIYEKVLKNPKDEKALEELKSLDEKLYNVALYVKKDEKTKSLYLRELAQYEKALKEKNVSKLNELSMKNDFLLKEFALFNKALLLTKEGKYKEANETLNLIQKDSKAFDLAKLLKHHLLTK